MVGKTVGTNRPRRGHGREKKEHCIASTPRLKYGEQLSSSTDDSNKVKKQGKKMSEDKPSNLQYTGLELPPEVRVCTVVGDSPFTEPVPRVSFQR